MAPATEEALGALYSWDSVVEDDFALPPGHQDRDEDRVEEAYEQIIHMASGQAADEVLSLAAQLLTKHFFRFPHVQLNVVGVLLALCQPTRAPAVRIHTVHSLLQIVKMPPAAAAADTPTSAATVARKNTCQWLQLMDKEVRERLSSETPGVVLQQMTALSDALQPRLLTLGVPSPRRGESAASNGRKKPREEMPDKTTVVDLTAPSSERESAERSRKKPRLADDQPIYQPPTKQDLKSGTNGDKGRSREEGTQSKKQSQSTEAPPSGRVVQKEVPRRPTKPPTSPSPRNCPPGPYLFLGSLPRQVTGADVAAYLSAICPEIERSSVQLKHPQDNATAYAFVSLPSTEVTREAICFAAEHKYHGQIQLNANFARGPPVSTLTFVEWTGMARAMEDEGAVRACDFSQYDQSVWDTLCQKLERVGPIECARDGCVRFRRMDHARMAVRMHHFDAKGHDLFPVYDTKEQFAIDSTRRGSETYVKKPFSLTTGRVVGGGMDGRSGSNGRGYYKDENDRMDGSGAPREHDRVASLKYGERSGSSNHGRSRSPPRSDRGSARGRSRSRSPTHRGSVGRRYDGSSSAYGPPKDQRTMPPRSRSRSPVPLEKQAANGGSGYGTPSNKENRREYRGKFDGPRPMDARGHDSPVRVDELRGRLREREGPWIEPSRPTMDHQGSRDSRDDGRGRGASRYGPLSPSSPSTMRTGEKPEEGTQRHGGNYRRSQSPGENMREPRQRDGPPQEDRGREPPLGRPAPRSRSRSPPRLAKHNSPTPASGRLQSRSRSPRPSNRMDNHPNERPNNYRGRGNSSMDRRAHEGRPPFQPGRPRYADDRSIAEVARDEQQERQRFFQQQQGRRDFRDGDLDRYGTGDRSGGHGHRPDDDRSRVEHHHASPQPHENGASTMAYREGPPHQEQHQPRGRYTREPREKLSPMPRPRDPAYSPSPSPSPLQQQQQHSSSRSQRKVDAEEAPERQLSRASEVAERPERDSSRHEHRRRHEGRSHSTHDKGHGGHLGHREKHSSRSGRSRTPSPVRRDHASASSGRKSNGASPRRSLSRRDGGSSQTEKSPTMEQTQRSNDDADPEQQKKKEAKKARPRLARDELFEAVDDLTVDYEEDD